MFKSVLSKVALAAVSASAVGALAFGGVASAQGVSENLGGSGLVNNSVVAADGSLTGATANWSRTTVTNNGGWYKVVNASITTTGGYGWQQTYQLQEKQKVAGGPVSVTGTVTVTTEYATYSEPILPISGTLTSIDIPFSSDSPSHVVTDHNSTVGRDLLNTEIDIVYAYHPGVNADYWFGY
jgi:hypothetical protein